LQKTETRRRGNKFTIKIKKENIMKRLSFLTLVIAGSTLLISGCCSTHASQNPCSVKLGTHRAVTPVPRPTHKWWMPRHEGVLKRNAEGNVDLILIGDSITHHFDDRGKAIWDKYYAPRNAVNMGFSGDRTEHVLWRIEHGELDGISPKLAIIMIGTNNSNGDDYTAEEIADGIKAIICEVRTRLPETKILLLKTFPRGDKAQRKDKAHDAAFNAQWEKNNKSCDIASQVADNKNIFYLDINDAFLNADGVLTREVMPDLLHPHEKGYKIWAEAMEPTVAQLMGEK
jgi:beta-glucosidase